MSEVWNLLSSPEFYSTVLQLSVPILFAALAAFVSNKAGILNIGIEGTMLVSSLAAAIVSTAAGNPYSGVLAGMAAGILAGLFFGFAVMGLKVDHILVGIALNILAAGLVVFVVYALTGNKSDYPSVPLPLLPIPFLSELPGIGPVLFDNLNLLAYLAFALVFATRWFIRRTVPGLRIRAVGQNALAAESVGIRSRRVKYLACVLTGLLAGLGGAYMSVGYMSSFNTGMIAGRGFIGIAAEAIGAGNPLWIAAFSLVFGAVNAFSLAAQTFAAIAIPYELLNTLPYLITLLGLFVFSLFRKGRKRKSPK